MWSKSNNVFYNETLNQKKPKPKTPHWCITKWHESSYEMTQMNSFHSIWNYYGQFSWVCHMHYQPTDSKNSNTTCWAIDACIIQNTHIILASISSYLFQAYKHMSFHMGRANLLTLVFNFVTQFATQFTISCFNFRFIFIGFFQSPFSGTGSSITYGFGLSFFGMSSCRTPPANQLKTFEELDLSGLTSNVLFQKRCCDGSMQWSVGTFGPWIRCIGNPHNPSDIAIDWECLLGWSLADS